MKSLTFDDAIKDAYYESKGVIPSEAKDASLRAFRNMYVDEAFYVDDPMSLELLRLRFQQCDMICRFGLGGQEEDLAKYTNLCVTDIEAAVSSFRMYMLVRS
jgi:hypothetical protein